MRPTPLRITPRIQEHPLSTQVHCQVCGVTTTPRRFGHTLAGLRTYTCPACLTPHTFSLGPFTNVLYVVFGVVLFAGTLNGLREAGYLILLVGYAFHKNRKLKETPARAELIETYGPPAPDAAAASTPHASTSDASTPAAPTLAASAPAGGPAPETRQG